MKDNTQKIEELEARNDELQERINELEQKDDKQTKDELLSLLKRFNDGEKMIQGGSSIPSYNPKTFFEQFYLYESGATYRLYVFLNNTWRYVDLT